MNKKEWGIAAGLLSVFLVAYFVPWGAPRVRGAGLEAFLMLQDYAHEHVILCLIPALFIAGAIGVFISQASVMKYFGAKANKFLSYSVASVSGTILAVCSCTVLPLFAGITSRGAGLGPAVAFLYSGPAINVLAIVLTARILGWKLGLARALGAIFLSIVAGLLMHLIFLKEERARQADADAFALPEEEGARPLWKTTLYFAAMVGILVFANWGKPADVNVTPVSGPVVSGTRVLENPAGMTVQAEDGTQTRIPREEIRSVSFGPGWYTTVYNTRFWIAGAFLLALLAMLALWFQKEELGLWGSSTWGFAKQILPLLFTGVLAAGFLLGRPGQEALIPNAWVASLVGGNSLWANFLASLSGALMYFATLTEVPILQGLIGSGMGRGPALSLLLAGPALSLPSMLVLRSVMGTKKLLAFVSIVVVLSTLAGWALGPWL